MARLKKHEGLILAAASLVLVLCLAYWRAISTHRAPYRLLTDLPIPAWVEGLYAYRWVVRGTMLAVAAALAALELWAGSVTRQVRGLLARPWAAFALLTVLTLAGRSYLLAPGRIALTDGLANVANVLAIRVALQQGYFPPYYWSNYAFMGFPWLQFHNSLFYYEGAVLDLVLQDGFLSTKLALLANHVAASWAMFVYVRRLTRSAFAALVSGTVWATAFFHYHYFVHVGSIHLSLLLPFLPAGLGCIEAILARHKTRLAVAGLALVECLLLWVHPYYGMLSAGLFGLYAVARWVFARRPAGGRWVRLALIAAGLALGGLAALSQVVPPVAESRLVGGGNQSARFLVPFPDLRHVLSFRGSFLTPDWWGGYLGLTVTGLAAAAVVLALVWRDRRAFGLLAWLGATWFLALGMAALPYDWIQEHVPGGNWVVVVAAQRKYLMFLEFALAALAGVAVREIGLGLMWLARRWLPARRAPLLTRRLALLAATAIGCEMIFLNLQVNSLYPEAWVGLEPGRATYLNWLHDHGDGQSRLLDTYLGNLEVWALSGQPSFISHYEEQPPSGGGILHLMDEVRADATAGRLSTVTRDQLYVLDIRYLVLDQPPPPDSGWQQLVDGDPFDLWQLRAHSPVVAAPALVLAGGLPSDQAEALVEAMEIDPQANAAARIPVETLPEGVEAQAGGGGAPLRLVVKDYRVGLTSVSLAYEVSGPAFLQLSYSAYPYLVLYLDGQKTDHFSTASYLIGLRTPAGEHRIELRPVLSPLRVACYWLDALGLVGIAVVFAWPRGRRQ